MTIAPSPANMASIFATLMRTAQDIIDSYDDLADPDDTFTGQLANLCESALDTIEAQYPEHFINLGAPADCYDILKAICYTLLNDPAILRHAAIGPNNG